MEVHLILIAVTLNLMLSAFRVGLVIRKGIINAKAAIEPALDRNWLHGKKRA